MNVIEFLSDASNYSGDDFEQPAPPQGRAAFQRTVEVRETHISVVFLTEHYAYKLKKCVRLDFLDFSTLERRKAACVDELRLNRRLAPSAYLAVVPVTIDEQGELALDGNGEPVEWLVKMRRLPERQTLQARIDSECVQEDDIERVIAALWRFFSQQPPAPINAEEYIDRIVAHIQANRETLLATSIAQSAQTSAAQIVSIHDSLMSFLDSHRDLLEERINQGRVIESHGDLRPEHVYLTPDPVFLDCIEFNLEFRTNDMLDEVCFLAMECRQLGADHIGNWVLDAYRRASRDDRNDELAEFYTCYRACVRAKVHLLRATQLTGFAATDATQVADRYLQLATTAASSASLAGVADRERESAPTTTSLSLIVVRGPAGVGKTTVAAKLADRLGCEHLQTDAIRRELLGADEADQRSTAHNMGKYSLKNRRLVYEELFRRAAGRLRKRQSVVVDGTFLRREFQRLAVDLARTHQAAILIVNCSCPSQTAAARIGRRAREACTLSEARAQTHQRQLAEQQLPEPSVPQCDVDTTIEMDANLEKIWNRLHAAQRV